MGGGRHPSRNMRLRTGAPAGFLPAAFPGPAVSAGGAAGASAEVCVDPDLFLSTAGWAKCTLSPGRCRRLG